MKPAHLAGAVKTRCARASYGCIDSRMTAAYATVYTVRAALSRSPFAFRCAASAPPRAASATKARNPSREPPPSRCARALGGTGWLAGWTPASLLVFRKRRGATPDPAAGGCARSAGARGTSPLKTRPRAARAPASFGVGVSGSPGRVRFALPARRSLILRPTSLRFVARACALVPLDGAGLDRLRVCFAHPARPAFTALPRCAWSCPFSCVARASPPRADGRWGALSRLAPRRYRARDRRAERPPPAFGGQYVPTLAAPPPAPLEGAGAAARRPAAFA